MDLNQNDGQTREKPHQEAAIERIDPNPEIAEQV